MKAQPSSALAHRRLAWLRATCLRASLRDGIEAIDQALQAARLEGSQGAESFDTLAAAYAEAGWFPEALAAARKALTLATRQNDTAVADAVRARIALYEAGKPFREPLTPN